MNFRGGYTYILRLFSRSSSFKALLRPGTSAHSQAITLSGGGLISLEEVGQVETPTSAERGSPSSRSAAMRNGKFKGLFVLAGAVSAICGWAPK
jgi:hypothetical protein